LPNGFYGLSSVLVLLALMALARIASIEQLRYAAAGEWGNLLGLDRVPEVRTLREKLKLLCAEQGRAARWNAAHVRKGLANGREPAVEAWAFDLRLRDPAKAALLVDSFECELSDEHVLYHGAIVGRGQTGSRPELLERRRTCLPATKARAPAGPSVTI
jgi:hypothetical protein